MSLLEEIFARKHMEVQAALQAQPLSEIKRVALEQPFPRGFRAALAQHSRPPALIAEIKKASPSEGIIRYDFHPANLAMRYASAGATCLSVLTDSYYFQGSADALREARDACDLPILRKDFIWHPYQVWEARAWGADAILLIVAYWQMAEREWQMSQIIGTARQAGLDVLVEVHTEEEMLRAIELGADLVGVNNRDLSTFKTDIGTSERLLPMLPADALGVSESALATPSDLRRVSRAGARAVLIGTTFCRQPDVGEAVGRLFSELWDVEPLPPA